MFEKCVCPPALKNSEPTVLLSHTTPDEQPPTPPPCRWPALITLPTLAKFQLVWRRLYDVLFPSCLVEHTLSSVCVLPEYQPGRSNFELVFVSRNPPDSSKEICYGDLVTEIL